MPAHGDNPATVATCGIREAGLPARVLTETATELNFEPSLAGLQGMSMGVSIAIHAAKLADAPWQAVVIISSFDSFFTVIKGQSSCQLGTSLGPLWAHATDWGYHWKSGFSIVEIQPHLHATSLNLPTLIANGTSDRVIDISSGRHLFASLPADNTQSWIKIPGADHDNMLITTYPIYADIAE